MVTGFSAIDGTAANAVETLFKRTGPVDPWRETIAKRFIDACILSPKIVVPLATNQANSGSEPLKVGPKIFWDLHQVDRTAIDVERFRIDREGSLESSDVQRLFEELAQKLRSSPVFLRRLRIWLELNREQDVFKQHLTPPGQFFHFSQREFENDPTVKKLYPAVGIGHEGLGYALDVILKYIKYMKVVEDYEERNGQLTFYLTHKLREECAPDVLGCPRLRAPEYPSNITFSDYFMKLRRVVGRNEFVRHMCEARAVMAERSFRACIPEDDEDTLDEINHRLWNRGLPPILEGKVFAKSLIGGIGSVAASLAGAAVSQDKAVGLMGAAAAGAAVFASKGIVKRGVEKLMEPVLGSSAELMWRGLAFGLPRFAQQQLHRRRCLVWMLRRPLSRKRR